MPCLAHSKYILDYIPVNSMNKENLFTSTTVTSYFYLGGKIRNPFIKPDKYYSRKTDERIICVTV